MMDVNVVIGDICNKIGTKNNKTVTDIPEYNIFPEIEKFIRSQRERKERDLAEIITKYDFVVGSYTWLHYMA